MKNEWKPVAWEDIREGDVVDNNIYDPTGDRPEIVEHVGNRYFVVTHFGKLVTRFRYSDDKPEDGENPWKRLEEVEETPQDCPFCLREGPHIKKIDDKYMKGFKVYCSWDVSCQSVGPVKPTEQAAIAAWNRIQLKPEGE
jgi:hypothetical protein